MNGAEFEIKGHGQWVGGKWDQSQWLERRHDSSQPGNKATEADPRPGGRICRWEGQSTESSP